jgi:hypothetical protein
VQYLARSAMAVTVTMVGSLSYAQPVHIEMLNSDNAKIGDKESQVVSKPKSPIEFVQNFKYIFDHDLLLKDNFYLEENIKNIFNLKIVKINKKDEEILILSNDFSDVFRREKTQEAFWWSMPSASLIVFKGYDASGLIRAGLSFGIKAGGPSFQETRQILGAKFELLNQVPSPHSVLSPATAAHGNESWRYELLEREVKKTITVAFNPGGELSNVQIKFQRLD